MIYLVVKVKIHFDTFSTGVVREFSRQTFRIPPDLQVFYEFYGTIYYSCGTHASPQFTHYRKEARRYLVIVIWNHRDA